MQPRPKMILAFVGNGKGAFAVTFKKAKGHGAFFGAAHIFLKFPLHDFVEGLFVHSGFLAHNGKTGQGRNSWETAQASFRRANYREPRLAGLPRLAVVAELVLAAGAAAARRQEVCQVLNRQSLRLA